MSWRQRYETLKRVGVGQVAMARAWIALNGDDRVHRHLDLAPGDLVVDVGAYEGEFTALVRRDYDAEVVAIEPVPEFIAVLNARFEDDPSVSLVPAALGRESGTISLQPAADSSSAWVLGDSSIQAPLVDVADLVDGRRVALLKMNAEGAEFDVLERLIETGQIHQVDGLLVQFHKFVPGAVARRRAIRRQLRVSHRCSLNVPWVWEVWRPKGHVA